MQYIKKYLTNFQYFILIFGFFFAFSANAQDYKFTLVLDAGHGGHDPGAMGDIIREKDINLAIELKLGEMIEQNFKDVNVVYTRKTDKYLTLQERADVVNNHHADLFICIHTNSSQGPMAFGAETYTLGLAKTKSNLDVAMRENSVITLEEDYKTKYQGFDPNSVESYIMFEFMQDKYIDRSVDFASSVQKQFKSYCNRVDRGVRQAGFWVLHRSACPSVLVEVGFLSNPSEERYLASSQGQKEIATGIYNAFVDYKRKSEKKSGHQISRATKKELKVKEEPENHQTETSVSDTPTLSESKINQNSFADTTTKFISTKQISVVTPVQRNKSIQPIFKIQLFALKISVKPKKEDFKGVSKVDNFVENGFKKYTIGAETEYKKIIKLRKTILPKFPEAFIIAFVGDRKITEKEALKLKK
jgi:N-acetylmuramoyl-L-alanine amidase